MEIIVNTSLATHREEVKNHKELFKFFVEIGTTFTMEDNDWKEVV